MDEDIKTAVKAMERAVNVLDSYQEAELGRALTGTHRTLQQGIMRVFLSFVHTLAENYDTGRYDLRNEASCKLAAEIRQLLKDKNTYLPLV